MLPQTQITLNTSLINIITPPSPYLSPSSNHFTNGTKIHDHIASFIYLPSTVYECESAASYSCEHSISQEKKEISMGNHYKTLLGNFERLIAFYNMLSQTMTRKHPTPSEHANKDILLREVLFLTRQSWLRWRITKFLNSLAILTVEHPEDLLYRQFYALWSVSSDSSTKSSLQHSLPIQTLLNTIINCSMVSEDQLFLNYIKHDIITSKILENKDHVLHNVISKLLNKRCLVSDRMKTHTSLNLQCGFSIEGKDFEGLNYEYESENHEEYSTTSGSSRAANDCHMKTVAETLTVSNENCSDMLYELYDGCYFGDLTISFSPEDKLYLPEEEYQDRTGGMPESSSSHWEKDYYRYPKSHTHESPRRSNYTSYQPKHTEARGKGSFYISYEPKQKEQDAEVVTTKETTSSATSNATNFPDVTNINPREPIATGYKPKPKANPTARLTVEVPKVNSQQEERVHSVRDKSGESLTSSTVKKQPKTSNSSLLPKSAKVLNAKITGNEKTHSSKAEKSKKKSANGKKEQDKGELKLWDMINVKGKLKTF